MLSMNLILLCLSGAGCMGVVMGASMKVFSQAMREKYFAKVEPTKTERELVKMMWGLGHAMFLLNLVFLMVLFLIKVGMMIAA